MKNNLYTLFLLSTLQLVFCGCEDKIYCDYLSTTPRIFGVAGNDGYNVTLDGTIDYTHFFADGSYIESYVGHTYYSAELKVTAGNTRWKIDNPASWVHLSQSEGASDATVTITVDENKSPEGRLAILSLASLEKDFPVSREIKVSQKGESPYAKPEQTTLTLDAKKQEYLIAVQSNSEWTCESSDDWLKATRSENKIILAVDENLTKVRKATVSIKKNSITRLATIEVTQNAAGINASKLSVEFGVDGGTDTITIESDVSWTCSTSSTSSSWLKATPVAGSAGRSNLQITASPNEARTTRSGTVYVKIDNTTKLNINVSQGGVVLKTNSPNLNFDKNADTRQLQITANRPWTAQADEDWIHLSPTSGTGDATINVGVDPNGASDERRGEIVFTSGSVKEKVSVVQNGIYIVVTCDDVFSDSRPASVNVSISSNAGWNAQSTENWLTVSPQQGTGNASLTVKAADNPSVSSRTAEVVIVSGDARKELSFTQPGRQLNLKPSSITFTQKGGQSDPVEIDTDGKYTVTTTDEWLTINQNGDASFTVSATANGNVNRTGTVTVSLTDLKAGETLSKTLQVLQKGKEESVDIDPWGTDEDWNTGNGEVTPGQPGTSDVDKDDYGTDEDWNP